MRGKKLFSSGRVAAVALLGLILFHVIANFWWLKTDTMPPMWDEAIHGYATLRLMQGLSGNGFANALSALISTQPYPPFGYLIGALISKATWPTIDAMIGSTTLFFCILIASTFGATKYIAGQKAGLVSAFIVSMYPILFGLSRHYVMDIALSAMVVTAIWLLFETNDFTRLAPSILFGVTLGLGLLTKRAFIVFICGPALVMLAVAMFRGDTVLRKSKFVNFALAMFIAAAIAEPWYMRNFDTQIPGVIGEINALPSINWDLYAAQLPAFQIFAPFCLLFAIALISIAINKKWSWHIAALIIGIVLSYALVLKHPIADTRYTIPYLSFFAILTGVGLTQIRPKLFRAAAIGVTVLYGLTQFAGMTFGLSQYISGIPSKLELYIGIVPLTIYREDIGIASPPRQQDWKLHEIVSGVMDDARARKLNPPSGLIRFVCLPDTAFLSASNLKFWAQMENAPIDVVYGSYTSEANLPAVMLGADYVLAKSGDPGGGGAGVYLTKFAEELAQPAANLGSHFTAITQIPLPDGSLAVVYRRN